MCGSAQGVLKVLSNPRAQLAFEGRHPTYLGEQRGSAEGRGSRRQPPSGQNSPEVGMGAHLDKAQKDSTLSPGGQG